VTVSDAPAPPRLWDELTLFATFLVVGISASVALIERGTDPAVVIIGSMAIFAVTSELAFIAVDDAGGSTVAGVLSGWLVASRFGILALAMRGRLPGPRIEQIGSGLVALDPNVGLALQQPDPHVRRRVYWRLTIGMAIGFTIGCVIGVALGNVLGDVRQWGFDVVFPATLLAIVGNQLRQGQARWAAIFAVAFFLAFLPWAPAGLPILASALGAVVVAVGGDRFGGEKEAGS
jgi:predicted branched-subunit amino acid permease